MKITSFRCEDKYLKPDVIYDDTYPILISREIYGHYCMDRSMFTTFEPLPSYRSQDGRMVQNRGRGIVRIELAENVRLKLLDVVYMPGMKIGLPEQPAVLISWPRLRDAGCVRHIDRFGNWIITRDGSLVVWGLLHVEWLRSSVFRIAVGPAKNDRETLRAGVGLVREPKGHCVDVGAVPVEKVKAGGHDAEEERTEVPVGVQKLEDGGEAWLRKIEQSLVQAKDTETEHGQSSGDARKPQPTSDRSMRNIEQGLVKPERGAGRDTGKSMQQEVQKTKRGDRWTVFK